MTGAIKTYSHLVTFAEYRKENDDPLQQAVYSDLLRALIEIEPEGETQARMVVYSVLSSLLKEGMDLVKDERYGDAFHAEVREILAIVAHYKDE